MLLSARAVNTALQSCWLPNYKLVVSRFMKSNFIVFEGLDGAGKTTAINILISRLESAGYSCKYQKGLCSDTFWGRISRRYPCSLTFLVEQVFLSYRRCPKFAQKVDFFFQDRYYYTVATYLPDCRKSYNRVLVRLCRLFLPKPDLLVYMHLSVTERRKRLENSLDNPYHKILYNNPELIAARDLEYAKIFSRYRGKKIVYDTTKISTTDVAQELLLFLTKE